MEKKTIRSSLKVQENPDGEAGMFISGYFSTFGGPPDYGNDIVDSGAFSKTIKERGPDGVNKIVGLWQHRAPLGMPVEIREDKKGGWFRMRLTDTPENRDTRWPYLTDGVVQEVSFAYDPIKYYYESEEGKNQWDQVRHLQEVALREISPVTFGMNPETSIDGFKSFTSRIEVELGLPGLFSGEEFDASKIEKIISVQNRKTINAAIASMSGVKKSLEALLKAAEPGQPTSDQEPQNEKAKPDLSVHLATLETLNQVIKSLKS